MDKWRCFLCGSQVLRQSDFYFEDYGYEGKGIVQNFVCSRCGAEYEVRSAFKDAEIEEPQADDRQITWSEVIDGNSKES